MSTISPRVDQPPRVRDRENVRGSICSSDRGDRPGRATEPRAAIEDHALVAKPGRRIERRRATSAGAGARPISSSHSRRAARRGRLARLRASRPAVPRSSGRSRAGTAGSGSPRPGDGCGTSTTEPRCRTTSMVHGPPVRQPTTIAFDTEDASSIDGGRLRRLGLGGHGASPSGRRRSVRAAARRSVDQRRREIVWRAARRTTRRRPSGGMRERRAARREGTAASSRATRRRATAAAAGARLRRAHRPRPDGRPRSGARGSDACGRCRSSSRTSETPPSGSTASDRRQGAVAPRRARLDIFCAIVADRGRSADRCVWPASRRAPHERDVFLHDVAIVELARRSRCARSCFAMTITPDVPRSSRCTMPGRSSPPTPLRPPTWWSRALTSVPRACPARRMHDHARPACRSPRCPRRRRGS